MEGVLADVQFGGHVGDELPREISYLPLPLLCDKSTVKRMSGQAEGYGSDIVLTRETKSLTLRECLCQKKFQRAACLIIESSGDLLR